MAKFLKRVQIAPKEEDEDINGKLKMKTDINNISALSMASTMTGSAIFERQEIKKLMNKDKEKKKDMLKMMLVMGLPVISLC